MSDPILELLQVLRHPVTTEAAAVQLLTQLIRRTAELVRAEVPPAPDPEPPPSELSQLEELPDWRHGTLLSWVLQAPAPPGCPQAWEASALLVLREAQLLGRLAMAVEQAITLGDLGTAHRVCALMSNQWRQIRGAQLLEQSFASQVSGLVEEDEDQS
jgi:hypothetical protein